MRDGFNFFCVVLLQLMADFEVFLVPGFSDTPKLVRECVAADKIFVLGVLSFDRVVLRLLSELGDLCLSRMLSLFGGIF